MTDMAVGSSFSKLLQEERRRIHAKREQEKRKKEAAKRLLECSRKEAKHNLRTEILGTLIKELRHAMREEKVFADVQIEEQSDAAIHRFSCLLTGASAGDGKKLFRIVAAASLKWEFVEHPVADAAGPIELAISCDLCPSARASVADWKPLCRPVTLDVHPTHTDKGAIRKWAWGALRDCALACLRDIEGDGGEPATDIRFIDPRDAPPSSVRPSPK
jgi:hypothetical protein